MKSIVRISVFFLVVTISACNSSEKEVEKLKSEVMKVHDEVMPKMDDIMRLSSELKEMEASLDSTQVDKMKMIERKKAALKSADSSMMDWMHSYDGEMLEMTDEEKMDYLNDEMVKIKAVKQRMLSAIADVEKFVEKK